MSVNKILGEAVLPRFLPTLVCSLAAVVAICVLLSSYAQKTSTVPKKLAGESPACTLYASPAGNDADLGREPNRPKTFVGAAATAGPGSVICLAGGIYRLISSFVPPHSGTPSAWIIYRSYGEVPAKFVWTGPADASPMFKLGTGNFPAGPAYVEFRGLQLDGGGKAGDGFFCRGGHHLRFVDNHISNTGGSGIGSIQCDYLTADHNIVYHNGFIPADAGKNAKYYSWTSGISFNSNQWYDSYAGFHNIIANNIVAGEVDQSAHRTDGNGIILDLSNRTYKRASANTPPALVINNVVYGNGGRCMEAYVVTNFWFVNNTCYKNNLDGAIGESAAISVIDSADGYVINDLVTVRKTSDRCYAEEKATADIRYDRNLCFGRSESSGAREPSQFFAADPLFLRPPYFHPTAAGQYAKAPPPSSLGDGLSLQPSSLAIRKGLDPTSLPNLPPALVSDLEKYFYSDIRGNPRHAGENPDLGAYQVQRGNP
jgi:hypothetical protein